MITNKTLDVKNIDFVKGEVILVNKNINCTSCDVVTRTKKIINFKKIGHAGTLDPKATGLLILCTGKETKSISGYQDMTKEYTGKMYLGNITPTMDTESEPVEPKSITDINIEKLKEAALTFLGEIEQTPPIFSAVRVQGRRAYNMARKGKTFELKSKKIVIKEFEIFDIGLPFVGFRIACSKGTYIRKLVHDFGQLLNCGAYLYELTRTKIGDFRVEDSVDMENLKLLFSREAVN